MYRHLSDLGINDEEREKLLIRVLKRIRKIGIEPKWLQKRRNKSTWNDIEKVYGVGSLKNIISDLDRLNLIESQGANKPYLITERGKRCCKRGWIKLKTNKYDNPIYPLIISLLALIISVIGTDRIWIGIAWVWHLFF